MTDSPPIEPTLGRVLRTRINVASLLLILFILPPAGLAHVVIYTFLPTRRELQRPRPDQRWTCLKRLLVVLVFDGSILYATYLVLPIASANTPAW